MSNTFKVKEKINNYSIYEIEDFKVRSSKIYNATSLIIDKDKKQFLSFYSEEDNEFKEKSNRIKLFLKNNKILELDKWIKENLNPNNFVKGDSYDLMVKELYLERKKEFENNNQNNKNLNKEKFDKGIKKYNKEYIQIPIFALIEALEANNYINMVGNLENNGGETKYRFEISGEDRKIDDNLIVSTVSRDQYEDNSEKANFYVEFKNYFKNIKGSAGEYNFMLDLERLGAFGEPVSKSSCENEEEYKELLKNKVRPLLNKLRRYSFENFGNNFVIKEKSGGFNSRRLTTPQTLYKNVSYNPKLKPLRELYETLSLRGFSNEVIQDSLNKNVIRFSTYINPKFGFRNYAICANMHNIFNTKYPQSFETFFVKEKGKFKKMFASIKRTQRNEDNLFTGENYILNVDLSKEKVKGTFFSEAVLDSIALKDIMSYCEIDYNKFNHIAAQGVGNMVNFFKENFGFYYMQDNDIDGEYKKGDIFIMEKEFDKKVIEKEDYEKIKNSLSKIKIKFIFDKSKKGSSPQLFKLKSFFEEFGVKDNIEVINIPYSNSKVDLKKDKDDGIYIMDNTNVDKFFEENNFIVNYIKENKKYEYFRSTYKELERPFDPEKDSLEELGLRVEKTLGSKNIYLSFDNDIAGLKHYIPLKKMCESIGLNCKATIPPFHIYGDNDNKKVINDNNDILMFIRYLDGLNKIDKKEIVSWVRKNFLDAVKGDFSIDWVEDSLKMAKNIKEIQSNKKITEGQKEEMLTVLLKKILHKKIKYLI